MEPSPDSDLLLISDPNITPPATQPSNEQGNNNHQNSHRGGRSGRARGRGRGRGRGPLDQPRKLSCHFHGTDTDHNTNPCPEKKKTLERMETEKKAKMVGHTSWPAPPNQPYTPTLPTFNPPFQPVPAFSYNPYPTN